MPRLPQFLEECPDYRWNPKSQMFEAHLFRILPDGGRRYTESYSIRPETYMRIIERMLQAVEDYERFRPAEVVNIKSAQGH